MRPMQFPRRFAWLIAMVLLVLFLPVVGLWNWVADPPVRYYYLGVYFESAFVMGEHPTVPVPVQWLYKTAPGRKQELAMVANAVSNSADGGFTAAGVSHEQDVRPQQQTPCTLPIEEILSQIRVELECGDAFARSLNQPSPTRGVGCRREFHGEMGMRPRTIQFFRRMDDGHCIHHEGYDENGELIRFYESSKSYELHVPHLFVAATNPSAVDVSCSKLRDEFTRSV